MTARNLAAICLIFLLAGRVSAKDIFVDNSLGDDANSGSEERVTGGGNGPTRTIGQALRNAAKGDRIILAKTDEPYRESITLQGGNHSGSAFHPLVIIGRGAVIDGTIPMEDLDWEPYLQDTARFAPPRMAFQTLFLGSEPASRSKLDYADLKTLAPKHWTLLDGYVYFRVEKDRLPSSYEPRYGGYPVGLTLYDITNVHIYDLEFKGFQLDGVNAHDNCFGVELYNVSGNNNGRSGISIGGASRVRLVDCAGKGNGVAQLRTEGYCKIEMEACRFDAAGAPAIDDREGGKILKR